VTLKTGIKGKFITFEGAEGSGKSTQSNLAYQYLQKIHRSVLHIREPGGVAISETVRKILLDAKNTSMCNECEVLLYMAARAQLVEEVLVPALQENKIVLCDRFLDSTLAYQGFGNGVGLDEIKKIGQFATQGIEPDLTLLFDIDIEEGLRRRGKERDRIEQRSLSYHERVRQGYLTMAQQEFSRIKVIHVEKKTPEEIHNIVRGYLDDLLEIAS